MPSRSRTKGGARESSDSTPQSESLLDFIINRGSLTERKVRPLAQQLARTLSLLHAYGVVHRNLKIENIFVCVDPPTCEARRHAIITDFTFAAVTVPVPASDSSVTPPPPSSPLVARRGEQYSPAPELLLTAEPGAQAIPVPYAGPPVDVWGFGVVLYTLVCGRVPFDGPTIDALHEASLCSPASLRFPRRVSKNCKDLLRRMLHADPVVRASLDEVLDHPWMNPPAFRWCPSVLVVGADVPKYAALKWPDQVNRKRFNRIAALESRNGDEAWRSLADALKLVSRLCDPYSGGDSRACALRPTSHEPAQKSSRLDFVTAWQGPQSCCAGLVHEETPNKDKDSLRFQASVAHAIIPLISCWGIR